MEKPNVTASAIISFVEKLEDNTAKFYEELAERYSEEKETFLAFAKDSKRSKVQVIRTYQETISDALEACFSFKGLNLSDYRVKTSLPEEMSHSDGFKMAIELEEEAGKFYSEVAECSKALLATIPRVFRKVAEKRKNRKLKLKSLLVKATSQR